MNKSCICGEYKRFSNFLSCGFDFVLYLGENVPLENLSDLDFIQKTNKKKGVKRIHRNIKRQVLECEAKFVGCLHKRIVPRC